MYSNVSSQDGGKIPSPNIVYAKHGKDFFAQHPNKKILTVCHSGGVAHVKSALKPLTEEEQQKIVVLAIAPSDCLTQRAFEGFAQLGLALFVSSGSGKREDKF